MFTDHAALHDYQERVQLLANLRAPCSRNSSNCITGEIRAASAALDIYAQNRPQLTVRRGAVTCGELTIYGSICDGHSMCLFCVQTSTSFV